MALKSYVVLAGTTPGVRTVNLALAAPSNLEFETAQQVTDDGLCTFQKIQDAATPGRPFKTIYLTNGGGYPTADNAVATADSTTLTADAAP